MAESYFNLAHSKESMVALSMSIVQVDPTNVCSERVKFFDALNPPCCLIRYVLFLYSSEVFASNFMDRIGA
jgi:hypothetical protein